MREQVTIAVSDITNNKARRGAVKGCLDQGLKRFQYSGFVGKLTPSRRKLLFDGIVALIKRSDNPGRVLVMPVCQTDYDQMFTFEQGDDEGGDDDDPGLC